MPMCYTCTRCGQCPDKMAFMPAPGDCAICGSANDPGAVVCASCGAPFPAKPGESLGNYKIIQPPENARKGSW